MRTPEQTAGSIADKASVAYISYIDTDGFPETRAMLAPGERNGIREFQLTTNTSSQKVKSFKSNPKACLYFADRRFFRGVCLSGTVEVLETPEAKERIWRDGDEQYYGQGVTDPDYCVLKFTAIRGRYYSSYRPEDFAV